MTMHRHDLNALLNWGSSLRCSDYNFHTLYEIYCDALSAISMSMTSFTFSVDENASSLIVSKCHIGGNVIANAPF